MDRTAETGQFSHHTHIRCQAALNQFLALCTDIGVPMVEEETEGPAHILTFACIELGCHKGEARLPQEKN